MTRFDFDVIGESPRPTSRPPEKPADSAQQRPPAQIPAAPTAARPEGAGQKPLT